jgi:hypothetical protein
VTVMRMLIAYFGYAQYKHWGFRNKSGEINKDSSFAHLQSRTG